MFLSALAKISSALAIFSSVLAKISCALAKISCALAEISCALAEISCALAEISCVVAVFSSVLVGNYVHCKSPTQIFPTKTSPLLALILFRRFLSLVAGFTWRLIIGYDRDSVFQLGDCQSQSLGCVNAIGTGHILLLNPAVKAGKGLSINIRHSITIL